MNELRWFLFSNRAAEGENLPPTSGSLVLHIRRAHYIAMIWKKAYESHPRLPAPTEFSWKQHTMHGSLWMLGFQLQQKSVQPDLEEN